MGIVVRNLEQKKKKKKKKKKEKKKKKVSEWLRKRLGNYVLMQVISCIFHSKT